MNFDLSDDQKMLVETARGFARKSSPLERFRKVRESAYDGGPGFERKMWRQMGELGWIGVMFPESVGGFGGRFIDLALVLEQLAATLVPEPLLASAVLAGVPIARAGSSEQAQRWLGDLVEGKSVIAAALSEEGTRYQLDRVACQARRDGRGYRLHGAKRWVLAGQDADHFLVAARAEGGPTLFVVPADAAGITVSPLKSMDGHGAAHVSFEDVAVGEDARIGDEGAGAEIAELGLDAAAAGACAEAVGIAQTVLDMSVEYLKTREQFGVVIGRFQALQHRAVDMFVEAELLRSLAIEACLRIDEGSDADRRAAVSAAKVQLSKGGRMVVRQGTQLHGGIGVTEEHDIGLYFKRMQVLSALFGDEHHHLRRFQFLPGFAP